MALSIDQLTEKITFNDTDILHLRQIDRIDKKILAKNLLAGYLEITATAADSDKLDGSHLADIQYYPLTSGALAITAVTDWDNYTNTGFYRGTNLANQSPGGSWRYCIVIKHNDLWVQQTMWDFNGTSMYQRNKVNDVWQSWKTFWHSLNDGSGSGLDADLLEGFHAQVAAGGDTIVLRNANGYIFANFFNTNPNDVVTGVTKVCIETGDDGYIRHGTQAAIRIFIGAGSGNGLDADLLDGLHASDISGGDTGVIGEIGMFDANNAGGGGTPPGTSGAWVDNVTKVGWYACVSGNADHGCPNLVDKFIMGKVVAGAGASGGSNTLIDHTHSSSIQSASHSHAGGGATSDSHTHTTNIGSHGHRAVSGYLGGSAYYVRTTGAFSAWITGQIESTNIGNKGSGTQIGEANHSHTNGNQTANHSHTIGSGNAPASTNSRPAYYSVIFIRKCA